MNRCVIALSVVHDSPGRSFREGDGGGCGCSGKGTFSLDSSRGEYSVKEWRIRVVTELFFSGTCGPVGIRHNHAAHPGRRGEGVGAKHPCQPDRLSGLQATIAGPSWYQDGGCFAPTDHRRPGPGPPTTDHRRPVPTHRPTPPIPITPAISPGYPSHIA
jgi:hypothetical protein